MAIREVCFDRAISFLANSPCELLHDYHLRLCVDLDRSIARRSTKLSLSISRGIGFPPAFYALEEQAHSTMVDRAIVQGGDMPTSNADEYVRELAYRFSVTWANTTIRLHLQKYDALHDWIDSSVFQSVSSLAETEVVIILDCPQASYQTPLCDCLALQSLVTHSTLQKAWKIANDEGLSFREFF